MPPGTNRADSLDILFIHGAPGVGKSSLARVLQAKLQSPCFEFGWIPEFRVTRDGVLTYAEEEGLAFENLALVARNYIRHGFGNIIITDLRDRILRQVPRRFARFRYRIVTLWAEDEDLLRRRVLDESRSSGFRDWEYALSLNREIRERPLLRQEIRVRNEGKTLDELAAEVMYCVGLGGTGREAGPA